MAYGLKIEASKWTPLRSVVYSPEKSASGNIVLRVGREMDEGVWSQTEHVVLTPAEAQEFAAELEAILQTGREKRPEGKVADGRGGWA